MAVRTCYILLLMTIARTAHGRQIVDLSHTLDENAPKYPIDVFGVEGAKLFEMKTLLEDYIGDMWLSLRTVEFYEHQGTHIDAPYHFGPGRQTLEAIPPEKLIGPGVVIDVRDKAKLNPDYAVTVEDIENHEAEYGRIPSNAIIMMNSGWGEKYPDSRQVFGTETYNDTTTFHFPGFSLDACKMLLRHRQVSVLGVDTPSTDPGQAATYYCHRYLQPNEVPLLEYVANLDSIPPRGTTIVLGAIKIRRGTGGPTRIFALIDDDDDHEERIANGSNQIVSTFSCFATTLLSFTLMLNI